MAKASAKDDDSFTAVDSSAKASAPEGQKSLQNAFLDWKRRQAAKAQPKNGGSGKSGTAGAKGAKARADDADAKLAGPPKAQAKPPAPFVAEANKPKAVRNLLDKVVDWYTNDTALRARLQAWFLEHAEGVPPIDMKRVGEGEYPVEAYGTFTAYTTFLEQIVAEFLQSEGGTLEDLQALAQDHTDVAYSDAWMFVTLFSACTTFLFFADMLKQAQEGDLEFNTTAGLNPKYSI